MAFTKYASFDVSDILEVKGSRDKRTASFDKLSDFDAYRTSDGYMYIRLRAISSRVNRNHDGWPTIELAGGPEIFNRYAHQSSSEGFTIESANGNKNLGFRTFVGKPIFVDHNNGDPKKTRGVIVDAKFRVLSPKEAALDEYWSSKEVDAAHLPASEIELLLEVDAKSFPKFAKDILCGDLDGFSMGADVERSVCSHCGNVASNPEEYCAHVISKGAIHDYKTADGHRTSKKSYENCYGIHYFEISGVFDPADPTALRREVIANSASGAVADYIRQAGKKKAVISPLDENGERLPDPVRPPSYEDEWQGNVDSLVNGYEKDNYYPQEILDRGQHIRQRAQDNLNDNYSVGAGEYSSDEAHHVPSRTPGSPGYVWPRDERGMPKAPEGYQPLTPKTINDPYQSSVKTA
ncbi:MAG: hypothetical protein ABSA33_04520, partial [Candidatus Micrarchaeaceae archaeon]